MANNPNPSIAEVREQAKKEPVFVNRLDIPIQVFDPNRAAVLVQPLALKGRHPNGKYEVHGEHYRQFCAPFGSLSEFRDAAVPPQVAKDVRAAVAADAERAAREKAGGPTIPPTVSAVRAAEPTRFGLPPQITLDTITAFEIQRQSPDANPQQRSDLASYVLARRAGNKDIKLHPSLATYEPAMNQIADGVDVKSAPPEDFAAHPENAPQTGLGPVSRVTEDGRLSLSDGSNARVEMPASAVEQADAAARAPHGQTASADAAAAVEAAKHGDALTQHEQSAGNTGGGSTGKAPGPKAAPPARKPGGR